MQKTPLYRTNTVAALLAVAATLPCMVPIAQGQQGGLAAREMNRRQEAVREADKLVLEGQEAYAKGDFQQAVDKFRKAVDRLPDAPVLADRRQAYINHLSTGSVALAMKYRQVGKYEEARALLNDVLKPDMDPESPEAKRELNYLNDPIRTPQALTYEHTQNVEKVRQGLYRAQSAYDLGKFDEAIREYEKVLRIDRYNSAARRGMEKVNVARSDYQRAAYDHTRSELLRMVDQAWELSVPVDAPSQTEFGDTRPTAESGVTYITQKLRTIIIPSINFDDTTVEEAIEFLRIRSRELDTTELDPARKGVNFVIRKPAATAAANTPADPTGGLPSTTEPGALRIKQLRLTQVPLAVALKYICDATKLRYKVDEYAVTLVPQTDTGEDLFTRTFRVPPDFNATLDSGGEGGGAAPAEDPFGSSSSGTGSAGNLRARPPITELLKRSGIVFPEGSSATLSGSNLLVTNTPTELDKIEQLVDLHSNKVPKQVKITTKFVEVSQENTDELGFDWLIGPFGLGGDALLGGGTIGNGLARTAADFISPVRGVPIDGVPLIPGANVSNIATGGLRSGDGAITRNNIDAILNNPNRTGQNANAAPGILALTGLFDNSQVQMIMRGLAQKKGTDLMTAPSVTARSGQKATIEIIREFIYPTEYDPPELPNSVGTSTTNNPLPGGGQSSVATFPVTPATPTSFETRNTGVTLEIEPIISDNDFTIDLRFIPEIVEFEGFINYGSPIQSPSTDALGNPTTVTITENRIEMPVFSSRRVTSALTIYDGYTVAVGGLMREDVQNVEDKVPILGDIPYLGRFFQSKAENRIKSNLIIFVTAQIIDATGRPIRGPESDRGTTSTAPVSAPAPGVGLPPGGDALPSPGVLPLPTP